MRFIGPVIGLSGLIILAYAFWQFSLTLPKPVELAVSHDYKEAQSRAARESKPMLLIFTASWCGPCRYLKKEVYPSADVQRIADRYIWVMLDVDDHGNRSLHEKYEVHGIPNIVITDSNGRVKNRQVGSSSPAEFANFLRNNL